jgi:hypothetical protein
MMREGVEVRRSDLNKVFTKSDRLFRIYNEILEWK